jgi:hypothetical protein
MPNVARSGRFRKELLPPARTFYEHEFGELRRSDSRGWATPKAGCPFHPSRSKQSFFVNLTSGGYFCFGCQASGGDVVSFVMKRHGLTFKAAAHLLGAWDDHECARWGPPTALICVLVCDFIVEGVLSRAEVRDEPKSDLERMRWLYHETAYRLTELRGGDSEKSENEEGTQWGIMAATWELIQMEVGR